MASQRILILVHPGSACGSANFNIGKSAAQAARSRLIDELDHNLCGLLVIDGDLSDELVDYPALNDAILDALKSAEEGEELSQRIFATDPDQVEGVRNFVEGLGEAAKGIDFTVSGAWYHPEDGQGCVGSVVNELVRLGCKAKVSDDAVHFSEEVPADDEEDDLNATQPRP